MYLNILIYLEKHKMHKVMYRQRLQAHFALGIFATTVRHFRFTCEAWNVSCIRNVFFRTAEMETEAWPGQAPEEENVISEKNESILIAKSTFFMAICAASGGVVLLARFQKK